MNWSILAYLFLLFAILFSILKNREKFANFLRNLADTIYRKEEMKKIESEKQKGGDASEQRIGIG